MKRIIDIAISLFLMLVLSPFLLIISIVIAYDLGMPIFFVQKRIGFNGKTIKLYKFRSMTNERDSDGSFLPNHLRVTKIGRFFRKTSIDELPSLINVIKGDLSLVGPRPLLIDYLPFYKPEHRSRHSVRPGITGLAQVNGRNAITWQDRLDFDKFYVENQSLLLDFKILFLTAYKVLKREGVEGDIDLSITRLDRDNSYLEGNDD